MIVNELASTSLFAHLPGIVLHELSQAAVEQRLAAGETLFQCGDDGDALYVVTAGMLEVVIETSVGERSTLDLVGPSEWVGELSVVNGGQRSASVFCLEAAGVIRVPAAACRELVLANPTVSAGFLEAIARRQPSHHLRACALFANLAPEVLRSLDQSAQWVRLPAGKMLCQAGDAADAVFVVVYGSLGVLAEEVKGLQLVDIIGRGASVGEMGALSGLSRSAGVQALRDSELVRIPSAAFQILLDQQPGAAKNLAHVLGSRLRHTTQTPRITRTVRTVALLAADGWRWPEEFVPAFAAAAARLVGSVMRLDPAMVDRQLGVGTASLDFADAASDRLSSWLNAQEAAYSLLIYECETAQPGWTSRALRQADLVLIVAPGGGGAGAMRPRLLAAEPEFGQARRELVLVHPANATRPSGTGAWLKECAFAGHRHLRLGQPADYDRLARAVTGRSVGVALSGGGARGFSHIGALRALRERNIAVDLIGGTSMGAVIAAQAALGWTTEMMVERNRKTFSESAVFGDLTFPLVSLMTGRSAVNVLEGMFGDTEIEDLWLPYFCVSTNLSRAEVVVHDRGSLSHWVRASSSVPGIGPPVPCNGDLLVDGGVLNNLPADIMRRRCPGPVIAMDAGASVDLRTQWEDCTSMTGWKHLWRTLNPWSKIPLFPNVFEILLRTTSMSSDQTLERIKKEADLYLHPALDSIPTLDWNAIDRAVEIGYHHASERIDAWLAANTQGEKHDK